MNLLSWIRGALAEVLARPPEAPAQWSPPRGLGLLPGLLAEIAAAPRSTVLPPIARDADGVSLLTAREWCARAGVPPHVGVLAVLLASEAPLMVAYGQYAWAIGEATLNASSAVHRRGASLASAIVRRCVGDSRPARDGRFGPQGGRWASTRQQPTRRHLRCAELLVARAEAGEPEILARGATQWTDNETQAAVHARANRSGDLGKALRNPQPEVVMARRYASGQHWIGPLVDAVGEVVLDPWRLSLLAPEGVDEATASAMLADGRRRWRR